MPLTEAQAALLWGIYEKVYRHIRETRIPVVHKTNRKVYGYVFVDYDGKPIEVGLHKWVYKKPVKIPGVCSEEVWTYKPCDESIFNSFERITESEFNGFWAQGLSNL